MNESQEPEPSASGSRSHSRMDDSSTWTEPGWDPPAPSTRMWLGMRLAFVVVTLGFLWISEPFAAARGAEEQTQRDVRAAAKLNEGLVLGRVHRQGMDEERVERVHLRWTNQTEVTWDGGIRVQCLGLSRDHQVMAEASQRVLRRSEGEIPPGASRKFVVAMDAPLGASHSISCSLVHARPATSRP